MWYLGDPDLGSSEVFAGMVARRTAAWFQEHGASFPIDATYLGLAAGQAQAEAKCAAGLGIKPTNVTLVDRVFKIPKEGFVLPEAQRITQGIFDYLENSPRANFDLVTALGIEYLLDSPRVIQTFISLLPRVIKPGGIVAIAPYTGATDPSLHLDTFGFDPLTSFTTFRRDSVSALMYIRRPTSQTK